jgi:fucose 4-O-acetylase-like acetyltransferase
VRSSSYPFVDWMKALGMSLIVYGHVAHATTVALTPPIYLKQFGVAFFLFATGFTLARERRSVVETVFNRLFQIYLFGIALAVLLTVLSLLNGGRGAPSNYLPFFLGANVVFDNFPANPTTWYLGTYIQLILLWAVCVRHVRVRGWMVLVAIGVEIPVRAWLMPTAGPYVAYMLLTNWIAVFLLGMARGADADNARPSVAEAFRPANGRWAATFMLATRSGRYAVALVAGLTAWGVAMHFLPFEPTFPFMTLSGWPPAASLVFVSASVSLLYVGTTMLLFEAIRHLETTPAPVAFIARNSLIIFLVHMPVYYLLGPILASWTTSYGTRAAIQLLVCLPGLALVSEGIVAAVRPGQLRGRVFESINRRARPGGQAALIMAQRGTSR